MILFLSHLYIRYKNPFANLNLILRNAFLVGLPLLSIIINIPQRFQIVNGKTPTQAGIRLLPLVLFIPFASTLSAILSTKMKVPFLYLLIVGSSFQLLGVALMTTLSVTQFQIQPMQYISQVILGLGFGLSVSTVMMMLPKYISDNDSGSSYISLLLLRGT